MAKIKHIALTTHDLEQVASFYKDVFGIAEVGRVGSTHIYLSDGDLNLTIRACKKRDDADVGTQVERRDAWNSVSSALRPYRACVKVRWDHPSMPSPSRDVRRGTLPPQRACSSDWWLTAADGSRHKASPSTRPPQRTSPTTCEPEPNGSALGTAMRRLWSGSWTSYARLES